ncbi:MAG: phytoene/squalene synthase family protein [Ferrimicrobium sp.]|uniref:phytoene/squalene synthase family protein n=1 Tax=Ferrimicrobium sp. TaxID=2926050 RepID=UPI002631ED2C|nr:phytoene/squalene synthase family protein [Ferrimicrobium sp.]
MTTRGLPKEIVAPSRALNQAHGKTYYLATLLLARHLRPYVFALYGFCRYVDDIVDVERDDDARRLAKVDSFRERFFAEVARGGSEEPILAATIATIDRFSMPISYFERFLGAMRQDFLVRRYPHIDDLLAYMDGSAAVIGEMMLPILGVDNPEAQAPARALGNAFQMTNFLRDINEDLDRGRIYVPEEDIDRFGAWDAFDQRRVTDEFRNLMAFEIARTRRWYAESYAGDDYLRGRALRCIRVARQVYGAILDEIEELDYDVFSARASVARTRRLKLLVRAAIAAC